MPPRPQNLLSNRARRLRPSGISAEDAAGSFPASRPPASHSSFHFPSQYSTYNCIPTGGMYCPFRALPPQRQKRRTRILVRSNVRPECLQYSCGSTLTAEFAVPTPLKHSGWIEGRPSILSKGRIFLSTVLNNSPANIYNYSATGLSLNISIFNTYSARPASFTLFFSTLLWLLCIQIFPPLLSTFLPYIHSSCITQSSSMLLS